MTKSNHKIILPDAILEKLKVKKGDKVKLSYSHYPAGKIVIEPVTQTDYHTNISPLRFFLPALFFTVLFGGYFYIRGQEPINLAGNESIASLTILLGTLSGSLVFASFYLKDRKLIQSWLGEKLYWRSFLTIMLSFVLILAISLLSFFWLLELLFEGAAFDLLTSSFIFLLFCSVVNYFMLYAESRLSPAVIFILFVCVIIGGALASMITNSNKHWWEHNVSFLGTSQASSSWQFNLTLITSALLLAALIDFIFAALDQKFGRNRRLFILHILLTAFAVCLGGVGLFANNGRGLLHELHTQAASLMVYLLLIIIALVGILLPQMEPTFKHLSYAIGASLLGASLLFSPIGYLSLTAFELIAFVLSFSWLLLLLQQLQAMISTQKKHYEVVIK
ncbi:DUF998 domain-containing protein [Liquorilactobacillus satsumensis]|nr:AbrB/MazE/SpoVT family DNA-binding domain-containing protein [Liquorilactobacillus satsumensis]MCP9312703.1 DUF998 domain-containing protein [Liquorilactobacillus satsumensis]MCP9327518.1 DUF998 domain-containing protein [Liquorilactobacillus satsumensis]MCP9357554.1 DUF998 domain-containing protein [Liquorilactobacillus satsumensis]MCP9359889.1 DUF998 domain-containing protein [Liquorilactobacillus satsumensis]MCP9372559.1 DUF998 domain-containing protein [Liquorilactobacillus satsumensis]